MAVYRSLLSTRVTGVLCIPLSMGRLTHVPGDIDEADLESATEVAASRQLGADREAAPGDNREGAPHETTEDAAESTPDDDP